MDGFNENSNEQQAQQPRDAFTVSPKQSKWSSSGD